MVRKGAGFLALFFVPLAMIGGIVFVLMMVVIAMAQQPTEEPGPVGGIISGAGADQIPPEYIPIYEAAEKQFGVPWNLIAAIHRVETNFSTIRPMLSGAGAEGHMQFMPCTWTGWAHPSCGGLGAGNIPESEKINPALIQRYGGFGTDANADGFADPFDIEDAIFTAAKYLAKNGAAEGNIEKAVFAYNHSEKYVADVLGFMKLFVEQKENPIALQPGTGGFMRPLETAVTSRFGNRFHPVLGIWRLHGGIDFDCVTGDPIPAAKSGVVVYAGWQNASNPKEGYGLYVWVEHGGGYKTGYAHLSKTSVKVGDPVQPGDIVGACGTTGTSTGDHLHFEIFKNGTLVDPAPYLGL